MDAIAHLNARLDAGEVRLTFDAESGYLRSVLSTMQIAPESQTLVFSESSAQYRFIRPSNPRAVYFSDMSSVGWIRGAPVIEAASVVPGGAYQFYELSQEESPAPRFVARQSCLGCHKTPDTLGVPGPILLSTFQMPDDPNAYASGITVDHRTPFAERWGGWYVTAVQPIRSHRGNVPVIVPTPQFRPDAPRIAPPLTSVDAVMDRRGYLTPCSDVVALMTLDHQAHMTNLLARLSFESRSATHLDDATEIVKDVVDYMLFVDEAELPSPVRGACGFAEMFQAQGRRDSLGRSLREFELHRHLFKYRCSYMIDSGAFEALPETARHAVYTRLWKILSGEIRDRVYDGLPRDERSAIVQILTETKKDLPSVFRAIPEPPAESRTHIPPASPQAPTRRGTRPQ